VNLITALLRLKSHNQYFKDSLGPKHYETHPAIMSILSSSSPSNVYLGSPQVDKGFPTNCTKIQEADRKHQLQSYLV
jgi:hypothetical protein